MSPARAELAAQTHGATFRCCPKNWAVSSLGNQMAGREFNAAWMSGETVRGSGEGEPGWPKPAAGCSPSEDRPRG